MTNTTTNRNYKGMTKNTARVYGQTKKTLGQRIKDYFSYVINWYGDLYAKTGYRNFMY